MNAKERLDKSAGGLSEQLARLRFRSVGLTNMPSLRALGVAFGHVLVAIRVLTSDLPGPLVPAYRCLNQAPCFVCRNAAYRTRMFKNFPIACQPLIAAKCFRAGAARARPSVDNRQQLVRLWGTGTDIQRRTLRRLCNSRKRTDGL